MKNFKKILIVVLCFFLLIPAVNTQKVAAVDVTMGADARLYCDRETVKIGETFVVTVWLENITIPDGAIGCDIPLKYDANALELVDRQCIFPDQWEHYGASFCTVTIKPEENPYWLRSVCNSKDLILNKNRNVKADKVLGFTATFRAKASGAAVIETVEKVGYQNAYIVNADKNVTNYGVRGHKITVSVTKNGNAIGDISGDGYVDSFDAFLALRADAQLITLTADQKAVADVNRDGKIGTLDASLILQYDAGLISKF